MTKRQGPLQIIAEMLPLGPDEWISDRLDFAHEILLALNRGGYILLTRAHGEQEDKK